MKNTVSLLQVAVMWYQYQISQNQSILSQDPIIEIFPDNNFIQGKDFRFNLPIRNFGISDINSIHIHQDYYVARETKNGPQLMRVGPFLMDNGVSIKPLKKGKEENFVIDLKDKNINQELNNTLNRMDGGMKIGRLKLIYRRDADGKKYVQQVAFVIDYSGTVLIFDPDKREDDQPSPLGIPSFREIKSILGIT